MRARAGLLAALLLLGPELAGAQGVSGLLSQIRAGSAPGEVLDAEREERALEMAARSFGHAATRRVDDILRKGEEPSGALEQRLRDLAARATERFLDAAREALIEAKGDGLLTQKELAEEIAQVRARELEALEEDLRVSELGGRVPPAGAEETGRLAHALAMARYTLLERNPPVRWALLLVWVLGAVGAVRLGALLVRRAAGSGIGRPALAVRRALGALRAPLSLGAAAAGAWAGLAWIWLPAGLEAPLLAAVQLLFALSALWLAWNGSVPLGRLLARMATREAGQAAEEIADAARKALRLLALLLLALFVAGVLLETELTALLTTLGLVGVAVTIAAQDTLRNGVGALTLHGDRPFVVGDLVGFRGQLGTVEEIGFRSTRVRALEGHLVTIPNVEITRDKIDNWSARRWVLHHYAIDLVYATSAERVREAVELLQEILEEEKAPGGLEPHVYFEAFGEHSLRIEVWYYTATRSYWEAKRHRTRVNLEILRRMREAGFEFALPARTLFVGGGEVAPAERPGDGS